METPRSDTMMVDHRYDRVLLTIVLCLMGIGIVMVYSASVVSAELQFGDGTYYLKRQLAFMAAGLVLMIAAMNFPYQALERYAPLHGCVDLPAPVGPRTGHLELREGCESLAEPRHHPFAAQ
jgi:cell division protein FtsW (lipid II flippase)